MDRSLYPEGVEVHQVDLERTEDARSFHILKRHVDNSLNGVVLGLSVITNSGSQTLVDIDPGYGYAPNGELVQLASGVTAVALANYTANIENLITLVYTETHDDLRPHETSNKSLPTAADRSARLRIFTKAQYDLLPYTDDNFDNDARDRILVISSIIAQGSGVSLPTSAISQPPTFGSAINVSNTTGTITGMTISAAESGTANGTGIINWDISTGTLEWIAPGDIAGNPVNVLLGGIFNLESTPSNKNLLIFVSAAVLPATSQSDNVEIQNLYYEDVPRHSSEDIHHRSLIGSGVPTKNNPHGLTVTDLGIVGVPIEEHQTLFHSNGIRHDSDTSILLATVNTGTSPDELLISVSPNFYVYLNGILFTSPSQTTVSFTDVVDNTQILYDIYAKSGSNKQVDIEKLERVRFDALSTMTPHLQLRDISKNTIAGAGQIVFDNAGGYLQYTAPGDAAGANVLLPSITTAIRLHSDNRTEYIDVFVSPTLSGTGDVTASLTTLNLPTESELKDKLHISTVVYSGSATGFLGNGFGTNNSPNELLDKRLFGITSPKDLRSDAIPWFLGETTGAKSPAAITPFQVGLLDPNFDFYSPNNIYSDSHFQLHVTNKARVLGGSYEQGAILSQIQYSTIEDGRKCGIISQVLTDFTTGTMLDLVNVLAESYMRHTSSVFVTNTIESRARVDAGAEVFYLSGMYIGAPSGTHAAATEIHNLYGIKIGDQDRGTDNWAIKTGVGRVEFGDELRLSSGTGVHFNQTPTIGVASVMEYTNLFRTKGVTSVIDGATSPGSDGCRVSYVESTPPSATLNDFLTSDATLGSNALIIENTDILGIPQDGSIIFATTNASGIITPTLVIGGDGHTSPGMNNIYDCGISASRWRTIYSKRIDIITSTGIDAGTFVGDNSYGLVCSRSGTTDSPFRIIGSASDGAGDIGAMNLNTDEHRVKVYSNADWQRISTRIHELTSEQEITTWPTAVVDRHFSDSIYIFPVGQLRNGDVVRVTARVFIHDILPIPSYFSVSIQAGEPALIANGSGTTLATALARSGDINYNDDNLWLQGTFHVLDASGTNSCGGVGHTQDDLTTDVVRSHLSNYTPTNYYVYPSLKTTQFYLTFSLSGSTPTTFHIEMDQFTVEIL